MKDLLRFYFEPYTHVSPERRVRAGSDQQRGIQNRKSIPWKRRLNPSNTNSINGVY